MNEPRKWPLEGVPDWLQFQERYGAIAAPVDSATPPIRLARIYEAVLALAIFHEIRRAGTPDITWDMPRDFRARRGARSIPRNRPAPMTSSGALVSSGYNKITHRGSLPMGWDRAALCRSWSDDPKFAGSVGQFERRLASARRSACRPARRRWHACVRDAGPGPAEQIDDALRLRRNPANGVGDGICLFGQLSLLLIVDLS
jgi:hypothetical protein